MKRFARFALSLALATFAAAAVAAQDAPTVSAKQDIAVFALGYSGWGMDPAALGSIDAKIMKVFADIGRFTVIGQTQRLGSKDIGLFIKTLKAAKEKSFKLPSEFAFGEKAFTEADFEKLVGAFIIVIPSVTGFSIETETDLILGGTYRSCSLATSFSFIEAATGKTLGIAEVETTGSDKTSDTKAVAGAVGAIPDKLVYEIRKIPAFSISTKVLAVSGSEVKIELGKDMGIMAGDEYYVVGEEDVGGVKEPKDVALVVVTSVGSKVSTASVVYSDGPIAVGMPLREAPKSGSDLSAALGYVGYFAKSYGTGAGFLIDLKFASWRGSYPFSIQAGLAIDFDSDLYTPLIIYAGGGVELGMGRLYVDASAALGIGSTIIVDGDYLSNVGAMVDVSIGFIISQDFRVFARAGAGYFLGISTISESFGYYAIGAGATFRP